MSRENFFHQQTIERADTETQLDFVGELFTQKFHFVCADFFDVVKLHALTVTTCEVGEFVAVGGSQRGVVEDVNRDGRERVFKDGRHCCADEF